ncbi:hypothetical protein MKZ38_002072 [Zalerion maritima]|uniref:Ferrochelatase, mitochondrial n=1 Tax=Zalerion maritima TaxID=339359 RepID=A0AAD5S5A2_9PEZI|nr:hypothetical protein MKZ38_002072 [Zalerion maritima]
MPICNRFQTQPVDTVALRSAFSGHGEQDRMAQVREKIEQVRHAWLTNSRYRELTRTIQLWCDKHVKDQEVKDRLRRLLRGYRDYADIDLERPEKPPAGSYDALELYCSIPGYNFIYSLISTALRDENIENSQLLTATALVEWVTIDLYNLRLSQIGDSRYSNFEGVTHRGLSVSQSAVAEYKGILQRDDVSKRNFSVPLGLTSSTTDGGVMKDFAKPTNKGPEDSVRMHWIIHIYGIDHVLLKEYHRRYPLSVVTSICAMPVAHISPEGEKEILLRGAFFQLIAMEDREMDGKPYINLVMVMMNANRDHTTELSSNIDEKKRQREAFGRIVSASKYEVCSSLANEYSREEDADKYKELQRQTLDQLRDGHGIEAPCDDDLFASKSSEIPVWNGGFLMKSYPEHYAQRRRNFEEAIASRNWIEAEKVLSLEYEWRRSDWFNVGKLFYDDEVVERDNLTLLHELIAKAPAEVTDADNDQAWKRLIEEAYKPDVWKTLRSFDKSRETAEELALKRGLDGLAGHLRPIIRHPVDNSDLEDIQHQLHQMMKEKTTDFIYHRSFHFPQLSVMTEMVEPELWVPIPRLPAETFGSSSRRDNIRDCGGWGRLNGNHSLAVVLGVMTNRLSFLVWIGLKPKMVRAFDAEAVGTIASSGFGRLCRGEKPFKMPLHRAGGQLTRAARAAVSAPALATKNGLWLPRNNILAARAIASHAPPVTQDEVGSKGPTAMVFLNMGGPSSLDEVGDFLSRLFADGDLIPLGRLQNYLGPLISKRRTPKIQKQYAAIGGGSPIRRWSEHQSSEMCKILDKVSPQTAPHKPYVAFRYANPLTEEMYNKLLEDGFGNGKGGRAVAFTQYPQYSCSTTGSSLNELWKWRQRLEGMSGNPLEVKENGSIKWSVIDRWPVHPGLVEAVVSNVKAKLNEYPEERRDDVILLFSAHSLPMSVVNRGDPYPGEVAATCHAVMQRLGHTHHYRICWQSQVGPQPWLGPQTQSSVEEYVAKGQKDIVIIPIAFTSDHIETLFELDEEVIGGTGHESVKRVESLNGNPIFIQALADIAHAHLHSGKATSKQMGLRCPGCKSERCAESKKFFAGQEEHL